MTKEEFKEKFKVGDRITKPSWEKDMFTDITFTGVNFFSGIEQSGNEEVYYNFKDWQHYKEPVKKDLYGLKRWYSVSYEKGNVICVSLVYVKDEIDDVYWDDELINEYITEEEAIERGLKI